jgi:hypothetical protein
LSCSHDQPVENLLQFERGAAEGFQKLSQSSLLDLRCGTRNPGLSSISFASKSWVTGIAPAILRADIHDQRFRPFYLGPEGRDECVLSVHHEVFRLSAELDPNRKLHLDLLL